MVTNQNQIWKSDKLKKFPSLLVIKTLQKSLIHIRFVYNLFLKLLFGKNLPVKKRTADSILLQDKKRLFSVPNPVLEMWPYKCSLVANFCKLVA